MSLDKSDSFVDAEAGAEIGTAVLAQATENKEPPRKRYAAPSAPRVLRCMQTDVKG